MDDKKFKETYDKFNHLMATDEIFNEVFDNPAKYSYDTLEKEVLNKIGLNIDEYRDFAISLFKHMVKNQKDMKEILEDEEVREYLLDDDSDIDLDDIEEYLYGSNTDMDLTEDEVKYKN